jgi:hypothetical protein
VATSGPVLLKIPTKIPQPARAGAGWPAGAARGRPQSCPTVQPGALLRGNARVATRGDGRVVVELGWGITVYPARVAGERWRAVWHENGRRRQAEGASETRLAQKLEKVTERLAAGAPNMERPGADLIAYYLWPGRHPASRPWSRRHADTQRRLCQRFAAPVIAAVTCHTTTSCSPAMWRFGSGHVARTMSAVWTSSPKSGRSGSQAGLRVGKKDVISCVLRSLRQLERAVSGFTSPCPLPAGRRAPSRRSSAWPLSQRYAIVESASGTRLRVR